jgi:hypothetical protein
MILKGSGDSDMSRSYAVFDRYPLIGDSYYRLKQTNFDGTSKTFDPVLIRNTFKSKLSVYPNPFSTESLMIAGRGNINENTLVTVSDLSGRAVGVKKVYNNNSIQLTFPTDIEPGVYITTISTPGYTTQTIRIVR